MQIHNQSTPNIESSHWNAFKGGNSVSFQYLYKAYSPALYNYGTKFSKDKDLIKECIQDLFVALWIRRTSIGNPEHIKNYLYKSFRNTVFKKIQQLDKTERYEETENYNFEVSITVEDQMIDGEQQEQISKKLSKAMDKLTPRQREAIFLKFHEQLSYDEIAGVMGITTKASYKLMSRSLDFLRSNLSKEELLLFYAMLHLKFIS